LQGTGYFEEAEIDNHLSFVKDKEVEMQSAHDNYTELLERSKSIYK
jgi:hypothetical protein